MLYDAKGPPIFQVPNLSLDNFLANYRGLVLLGGVGTPQIVQVANPSFDLEKIKSGVAILWT